MDLISSYLQYGVYALITFAGMVVLSKSMNFRTSKHFDAADLIAGGNTAVGYRRAGVQLGFGIGMLGVLLGQSDPNFINDVANSLGYTIMMIIFMWSSLAVNDKVILPGISNNQHVKDNNVAVGIVEFGSLVATGIVGFASIYGDSGDWKSSVGYFILGQLTMIVLVLLFEKLTKENNLIQDIAEGKKAPAIYLAGKTIAMSFIMLSAIKGNDVDLSAQEAFSNYIFAAGIGMIFLIVSELLIDKFIVLKTNVHTALRDNNVSAILQLSGSRIGMAIILGFAILS